ncbi:MAG: FtsX-like permease family protein [Candidatus Babeliales bacterium]
MGLYLSTLMAFRFLRAATHKKSMRTVLLSAVISMGLSTGALIFIDAISTGFQKATVRGLQGINADIILSTPTGSLAIEPLLAVLTKEFPAIQAASPYSITQGLIQSANKKKGPLAAFIKGIDPTQEMKVSTLPFLYRASDKYPTFQDGCTGNRVLLGNTLAREMHVMLDDTVSLLIPSFDEQGNGTVHPVTARIGGIIKTGIEDLDSTLVVADYRLFESIEAVTLDHLGIAMVPGTDSAALVAALHTRMPSLTIYAWTELYPGMLDALKLEQRAFMLILTVLIAIASITIIAAITMLITHKRREIFILYLMGMEEAAIKTIFYRITLLLTGFSAAVGIALAWVLGTIIEKYQLIALPDAYYISYLPVCLHYTHTLVVWCIAVGIGFVAARIATHALSADTMQTIKREE